MSVAVGICVGWDVGGGVIRYCDSGVGARPAEMER